jgi:hypothetical protein
MKQCVLNQTHRYLLLFDALHVAICINIKLKGEFNHRFLAQPPLQCGDFDLQLKIMYDCIVIKVLSILEPLLSFMRGFQSGKVHNMLAFTIDPRFKHMQCITNFLGKDRTKFVVGEYDKKVIHVFIVKVNKTLDLVTSHNASKDANLFMNSFDGPTFV